MYMGGLVLLLCEFLKQILYCLRRNHYNLQSMCNIFHNKSTVVQPRVSSLGHMSLQQLTALTIVWFQACKLMCFMSVL